MGKDVKYKLLVRALNLDTEEELAQLVSEGFTVNTAACGKRCDCVLHNVQCVTWDTVCVGGLCCKHCCLRTPL